MVHGGVEGKKKDGMGGRRLWRMERSSGVSNALTEGDHRRRSIRAKVRRGGGRKAAGESASVAWRGLKG